jgi:hypothetical protein
VVDIGGRSGLSAHSLEEELTYLHHARPSAGPHLNTVTWPHKLGGFGPCAVDAHMSRAAGDCGLRAGLGEPDGPHPHIHSHRIDSHPLRVRGATYP